MSLLLQAQVWSEKLSFDEMEISAGVNVQILKHLHYCMYNSRILDLAQNYLHNVS